MKLRIENGKRTILGTDWPEVCLIENTGTGRRPWLLTVGLCNGSAAGGYYCATKRLAVELAEARNFDQDPALFGALLKAHGDEIVIGK